MPPSSNSGRPIFYSPLIYTLVTHLFTPTSRVLLEKLTGSQIVKKNSPYLMESEVSLPHSQVPTTCPNPEPYLSHFLNIHLNIILPSIPGSSKWYLPSDFPIHTLYTTLMSPYLIHAQPSYLHLGLGNGLLLSSLPTQTYKYVSFLACVSRLPPSSPSLIWSADNN